MRMALSAALVVLACSPLAADVEVQMAGDRVSLRAVSAPVAEVLERLARTTGMRVVYDGPVPRQSLTTTLEAREPAEAVLSLLEGLGLNYALVMDPSGMRVDQLLILGASAAAPPPAARNSPVGVPPAARRNVPQDDDATDEMVEAMEEEVQAQQGQDDVADDEDMNPQPTPAPPPEPEQLRAPEYPSSSFTPKIPMPAPPAPSPQASPSPPSRQ